VAVCYYGTYLLTLAAALWGDRKGTIPDAPPGTMNLGKWLRPLSWFGIAFTLVIAGFMTLPKATNCVGTLPDVASTFVRVGARTVRVHGECVPRYARLWRALTAAVKLSST